MPYVDGFVIPISKKSLSAYRRMARAAGRIWMDHGAVEYRECVGDDLNVADPRMQKMMDPAKMPFDGKRMAYGGFKTFVDM